MSRFRLYPTSAQEQALLGHCAHARYVWNLAVEQRSWWQPGRPSPGFAEQCRQLSEARQSYDWLSDGSVIVQQQALRDFHAAWSAFFAALRAWCPRAGRFPPEQRPSPPAPPGFRKRGLDEGFRIVAVGPADVRRLNRKWGQVAVPKLGWVRFRWSREVAPAKSYRVTCDRARRWHVAFAVVPPTVEAPGNGEGVGVDRGVAVSAALSTGELLGVPGLRPAEARRLRLLERRKARQRKGSGRRRRTVRAIRTQPGRNVRQKAGLNRGILASGWGKLVKRLEDKAPGRVIMVPAAYTSLRCSACGHLARENRESQPVFLCVACGFASNADVNASLNILAAGRAVAARGGRGLPRPSNREPHLMASSAA